MPCNLFWLWVRRNQNCGSHEVFRVDRYIFKNLLENNIINIIDKKIIINQVGHLKLSNGSVGDPRVIVCR